MFDPTSRELEISGWREWSWILEQYVRSIGLEFGSEPTTICANPSTPLDPSVQDDGEKEREALLYSFLGSLISPSTSVDGCEKCERKQWL